MKGDDRDAREYQVNAELRRKVSGAVVRSWDA